MSLRGGSCVSVHGMPVIAAIAALLSMSVVVYGVSEQSEITVQGSGQMSLEEQAEPSTEAMNELIGAVDSGMSEEAGDADLKRQFQKDKAHHKAHHHRSHAKSKGKGLMRSESGQETIPDLNEQGSPMGDSGSPPHQLPQEAAFAFSHMPKRHPRGHKKHEDKPESNKPASDKPAASKPAMPAAAAASVDTLEVQEAKAKVAQASKSLQRQLALEAVMKAAQEVALDRQKEESAEEDLRKKAELLNEVSNGKAAEMPMPAPVIDQKFEALKMPSSPKVEEKAKDLQAEKPPQAKDLHAEKPAESHATPATKNIPKAAGFVHGLHMSPHTPGQEEHWLTPHKVSLQASKQDLAASPAKDSATPPAANKPAAAASGFAHGVHLSHHSPAGQEEHWLTPHVIAGSSSHTPEKPTSTIHGAHTEAQNLIATQPGLPYVPPAEETHMMVQKRHAAEEQQKETARLKKKKADLAIQRANEDNAFHESLRKQGRPDPWAESGDGHRPGEAPELMARSNTEPSCMTCQCKFMDRHGANSECDSGYPLRILVSKWLHPNSTVLELGAKYGAASCAIAEKQHNSGRLVSVEPDHRIWETLENNRAKNRCNFSTVRGVLGTSSMEAVETGDDSDEPMELLSFGGTKRSEKNTIIPHVSLQQIQTRKGMKFDSAILDCDGCLPKLLDESPEIFDNMKLLVLALHNMTGFDRLRQLPVMRNFTLVQETDNFRVLRHNTGPMSSAVLRETLTPLEKPDLDFYVGTHGRPNWVLLQTEEEERKKKEERL